MSVQNVTHDDQFRAGKALGLNHLKLGMWLFIGSEVMFFGGLIAAFLHYKVNNPSPLETALLDVTLVGINTFILLSSSFTVVLGLSSIQRGDRKGLVRYLGLTALLGAVTAKCGSALTMSANCDSGVVASSDPRPFRSSREPRLLARPSAVTAHST